MPALEIADLLSKGRLELVRATARKMWIKNTPEEVANQMLWRFDCFIKAHLFKISPLFPYKDRPLVYCLWGSGSFSTGRVQLIETLEQKKELGRRSPIEVGGIVTNCKDSNAANLRDEIKEEYNFEIPLVEEDFGEWYYDETGEKLEYKKAVRATKFFFPELIGRKSDDPWPEGVPEEPELKRRFELRKKYDLFLQERIKEAVGSMPDINSLRGYSFPVGVDAEDTHPADLSYLHKDGTPLYAGWQAGATAGMIRDGIPVYRSSLIIVNPVKDFAQSQTVDTGELLALGTGIEASLVPDVDAKTLQNILKKTDDYVLCALVGTGLLPYFWGITETEHLVNYKTLSQHDADIIQRGIFVANTEYSGKNAFGKNLAEDLDRLVSSLTIIRVK